MVILFIYLLLLTVNNGVCLSKTNIVWNFRRIQRLLGTCKNSPLVYVCLKCEDQNKLCGFRHHTSKEIFALKSNIKLKKNLYSS